MGWLLSARDWTWMNGEWIIAIPPFIAAVVFFIGPRSGRAPVGWDVRAVAPYFLAPALSVAIVAVAANIAPFIGLPWSALPVVILTAVAAAAAFVLTSMGRP